jgi:hypothetical protein
MRASLESLDMWEHPFPLEPLCGEKHIRLISDVWEGMFADIKIDSHSFHVSVIDTYARA